MVLLHRYLSQAGLIGLITLAGFLLGGFSASHASASVNEPYAIHLPVVGKNDFDLKVTNVKLIQGITVSENYSVYVANRETFVRVFVGTTTGKKVKGVSARLCGYDAQGVRLGCIEPQNDPIVAPSTESKIEGTINFRLSTDWEKPGYGFHVILDPDHLIHESNRTNNRYPSQGIQPFNFTFAPALNLMVLPVRYKPFPTENTFFPETGNLDYLTWMPEKVLPIPGAIYQMHAPYSYFPITRDQNLDQSAGWMELLDQLTTIHNMEDPTGTLNYYGVVNSYDAHLCQNGCITGVSNLGAKGGNLTGVGWSGYGAGTNEASRTMVHELGHNFGRSHVNCTGSEPNPDPNYPYPGGSIGQWGLDVIEGILYDPEIYKDYMSYCPDPDVWTSDYTYWNIYVYRKTALNQSVDLPQTRTLYISGYQTPDGQVHLDPIYDQVSQFTGFQAGNYQVELLGERGSVLATYPFQMIEVADIAGFSHFGFFVPAIDGLRGVRILEGDRILAERLVQGEMPVFPPGSSGFTTQLKDESLILHWTDLQQSGEQISYRLRLSLDQGRSWQVLALKLDSSIFNMSIEPGTDLSQAIFEVQASNGVQTSNTYFYMNSR